MDKQWYVVNTYSGHEKKVKENDNWDTDSNAKIGDEVE